MGLVFDDNLPENEIFEVSLIGTGGGYGESIVIHLGNQEWIVVDSCIDPYTKKCLPLEYLISKKVDVSKNVKMIICTHWHDDHIRGISELFESCESSAFCMASVSDRKKFLSFVGLDYNKIEKDASTASTIEITKCLEIVKLRNLQIKAAAQDRLLLKLSFAKIYSLSPSDFVINEFNNEISTLITEYGASNRKVIIQTPNEKSVALYITVNNYGVLLGSDLEVSTNKNKGWICILDNCQCFETRASLFKIPHHGSINGYHPRIWNELLNKNAVAQLTPWNQAGKVLPCKDMLECYLNHTDELYSTSSNALSNTAKKREKSIAKAIKNFNSSVSEVKYKLGIIRCQLNFLERNAKWNTDLFGEAIKILQVN